MQALEDNANRNRQRIQHNNAKRPFYLDTAKHHDYTYLKSYKDKFTFATRKKEKVSS